MQFLPVNNLQNGSRHERKLDVGMARYFGGFRDRLKKRSKHLPITIKDVEWVKVATTFSWSPARRDYLWQEPEDYLSSFLNNNETSYDEIQGDGSIDDSISLAGSAYDGPESLIRESDDEEMDGDDTIAYIPPYDFVPESAYNEENVLRPNIDVPAELPLLDEYKLEIISALQRRGIRIEISKIKLPTDLADQLHGYHEGLVSIDSYELRARLQKYKRQVIESYEQFNSASGHFGSSSDLLNDSNSVEVDATDELGQEENYESYILSSLNRLEESMKEDDVLQEDSELDVQAHNQAQESELTEPDPEIFENSDQALDVEASIRTTRHIETPPNTSDKLAEGLSGPDLNEIAHPEELPSSYADDSWLVLPVDSRKAGKVLENPDDQDDLLRKDQLQKDQLQEDPLQEDQLQEDPLRKDQLQKDQLQEDPLQKDQDDELATESGEGADAQMGRSDSTELLKALNTINSRFTESTTDDEELDLSGETLGAVDDNEANLSSDPFSSASPDEPLDINTLSNFLLKLRHEGDRTILDESHSAAETELPEDDIQAPSVATNEEFAPEPVDSIESSTPPPAEDAPKEEESLSAEAVEQRRAQYIAMQRKKLYSLIDDLEGNTTKAEPDQPAVNATEETAAPVADSVEQPEEKVEEAQTDAVLDIQNALLKSDKLEEEPEASLGKGLEVEAPANKISELEEVFAEVVEPVKESVSDEDPSAELENDDGQTFRDKPVKLESAIETDDASGDDFPLDEAVPENADLAARLGEEIENATQDTKEPETHVADSDISELKAAEIGSSSNEELEAVHSVEKVVEERKDQDNEASSRQEGKAEASSSEAHIVTPEQLVTKVGELKAKQENILDSKEYPVDHEIVKPEPQKRSFGSLDVRVSRPEEPIKSKQTARRTRSEREESLQNELSASLNPSEPVFSPEEKPGDDVKQKIIEPSDASSVIEDAQLKGAGPMSKQKEKQSQDLRRVSKEKTVMAEPQTTENEKPEISESSESTPHASDLPLETLPAEDRINERNENAEVGVSLVELVTEEEITERQKPDEGLTEADQVVPQDASLEGVIESLAFATEDPIPLKKIARIYSEILGVRMPTEKKVRAAIQGLNEEYEANGRSYRIKEWAGGIRMASHPQYARFIRALYKDHRPKKLSRTLMETLAIVAYSQPTTKPEIDFVRGVDSDYAVRKLLELGLIDIVGRSDSIGRPLLYGTSERFLEQFGLSEIGALPKLREVEDLLGDPAFKKERLQLLALEEMDTATSNDEEGAPVEAEESTKDSGEAIEDSNKPDPT